MAPRIAVPPSFADRRSRQATLRPSTSGTARLPPFGSVGAPRPPGRGARWGSPARGDATATPAREARCPPGAIASVGLGWLFHDPPFSGRDGAPKGSAAAPLQGAPIRDALVGGDAAGAGAELGGGRSKLPATAPAGSDASEPRGSAERGGGAADEADADRGEEVACGADKDAPRGNGRDEAAAGPEAGRPGPEDGEGAGGARAEAPYPSLFPPSADELAEPARLRLARLPLPMASEASLFDGMVRLVALGALADLPGLARRAVLGAARRAEGARAGGGAEAGAGAGAGQEAGATGAGPIGTGAGGRGSPSASPETLRDVSATSPLLDALSPLLRLPLAAGRAAASAPLAARRRLRRRLLLVRRAARGGLRGALDRAPRGGGALGRALRRSLERLIGPEEGEEVEGGEGAGGGEAGLGGGLEVGRPSSDAAALSQLRARLLSRARYLESLLDVRAALQCAEEAATLFPDDPDVLLAAAKQWTDLTFHPDVADDDERRLVNQRSIALADKALDIVANGREEATPDASAAAAVHGAPSATPPSTPSSAAPSPSPSSLAPPSTPSSPTTSPSSPMHPVRLRSRPLLIGCVARGRLALFARSTRDKVRLATEAREAAAEALRADPEADFALHAVARWEYELAKLPAVLRRAARLLGVPRVPPGSLDAALRGYEAAERRSPLRILHPVERARVLGELGRKQEALQALNHALEACPIADINDWHARADGLRLRAQLGGEKCPEPRLVVGRPLDGWGAAGPPPALLWPGGGKVEGRGDDKDAEGGERT